MSLPLLSPPEYSEGLFLWSYFSTKAHNLTNFECYDLRALITIILIAIVANLNAQLESQSVLNDFRKQSRKAVRDVELYPSAQLQDSIISISDLRFFFGANESQLLGINHRQRLAKGVYMDLAYKGSSGEGSLVNDDFKYSRTRFKLTVDRPKFGNRFFTSYFADGRNLNGGLASDSTFINSDFEQNLLAVNLTNNSSSFKRFQLHDTIQFKFGERFALLPSFNYQHQDRNYAGNGWSDSSFFDNILIDSNTTADYYRNRRLNGGISVQYTRESWRLLLGVFSDHEYYYNVQRIDTHGIGIGLQIRKELKAGAFDLYGRYYISGYRGNGYELRAEMNSHIDTLRRITVNLSSELLPYPFQWLLYQGNHFQWNYNMITYPNMNLAKVTYVDSSLSLTTSLQAFYARNYYYFDTLFTPDQVDQAHFMRLDLNKTFHLGRFRFPLSGTTNFWTSDQIRLPEFKLSGGVFASVLAFKAKLRLELGARASWYASYLANAFEPSTGFTYLQNQREVGNYPYMDLILRSTISGASFYLMLTHANEDLTGRNYYIRPGYLELGRRFLFGVTWRFIN